MDFQRHTTRVVQRTAQIQSTAVYANRQPVAESAARHRFYIRANGRAAARRGNRAGQSAPAMRASCGLLRSHTRQKAERVGGALDQAVDPPRSFFVAPRESGGLEGWASLAALDTHLRGHDDQWGMPSVRVRSATTLALERAPARAHRVIMVGGVEPALGRAVAG